MKGEDQMPALSKKVLHLGEGDYERLKTGSKLTFHFVTKLEDGTVIDDSRKWEKPMELVVGKKFKLEVWETALTSMRIGEVSSFKAGRRETCNYPVVARTLRDTFTPGGRKKTEHRGHSCSMMALSMEGGLGYDDLNKLIKNPAPLEFILELLNVESPDEYEKETWQMDADEKRDSVAKLKLQGNELFREKEYVAAASKYAEAIGRLEQLILREKPQDEAWHELRKEKVPLLLNYSQCKLVGGEYYPVVEHCTEVLEIDPDNVKALYRRGKAHVGAWNPIEAKSDFNKVSSLDPSLDKACSKEIKSIELLEKQKDFEDREKLKKIFT